MIQKFTSKITGYDKITLYQPKIYDDSECTEVTVQWSLSMEFRNDGVKSIDVEVDNVMFNYNTLIFQDDMSKDKEEEMSFELLPVRDKFTVIVNSNVIFDGALYPQDIEINLIKNTIEVNF